MSKRLDYLCFIIVAVLSPISTTELSKTLVVGILEQKEIKPYVQIIQTRNGEQEYRGFIPDLMFILSKRLGFNTLFKVIRPPEHGYYNNETLKWTGLIGELILKQKKGDPDNLKVGIDIAAAPILMTPDRERVVDFVKPFQHLGMIIVIQKSSPEKEIDFMFTIFQPIHASVWALVVIGIIVISFLLWLMNVFNPYEYGCRHNLGLAEKQDSELFNLSGSIWFTVTTLFWQGFERPPRSVASKFITGTWFAFTTIFLTTYVAGIVTNLMWSSLAPAASIAQKPAIIDLSHLLSTRTDYKIGTVVDSPMYNYITKVAVGEEFKYLARVWSTDEGKQLLVNTTSEGLERVRQEKYAFVIDSMTANYYVNKRPCDLATVGEEFGRRSYGFALPHNSPLLELFHSAILKMTEDGDLEQLQKRWFFDKGECWNVTEAERAAARTRLDAKQPQRIDSEAFWGPLVLVIVGVIISCLIAVAEIFYHRFKGMYANQSTNRPQRHVRLVPDDGGFM